MIINKLVIENEHKISLIVFVNLVGIASPGLTSSMVIARHIRPMVDETLGN